MSEEVFNNELDEFGFNQNQEQKPTFLIVLLVLTWITVAVSVLSGVFSLINIGNSADQLEQSLEVFDSLPSGDPIVEEYMEAYKEFVMATMENIRPITLGKIILYLLEGFAALLMFNLKRLGFWLYSICQIGFILLTYSFLPSENIMTTISIIYIVIVSGVFVFLYGLNLKHLTK